MSDHSGPLDDLDEIHDNFDDDFGDEHAYDDAASDEQPAAGDVLEVCCAGDNLTIHIWGVASNDAYLSVGGIGRGKGPIKQAEHLTALTAALNDTASTHDTAQHSR